MNQNVSAPAFLNYLEIYQISKRVIDLTICLFVLPVAALVMLICAIMIRLDSPGPVIFVQERIGKGGRRFRMYKFRTMKLGAETNVQCQAFMKAFVRGDSVEVENFEIGNRYQEEHSHQPSIVKRDCARIFKPIHADQVTRVGCLLRKTSLDELPQIINVLKGEMSLVGPRPNVPWEVDAYRLWHFERIEVLPGITGLAQIRGRSSIDFASIVRYDIRYIKNRSLIMDLKILWWTVSSVFCGRGAG